MKTKFPAAVALEAARECIAALRAHCAPRPGVTEEALIVAGSLRRRKKEVGDVEILYIPAMGKEAGHDLFRAMPYDKAARAINDLLDRGIIERRLKDNGQKTWGGQIRLARHIATGVPVDFFAATPQNWWNYLVCRTGSKESNIAIAENAKKKGWRWHPFGPGFTDSLGRWMTVRCERDVFRLADLEYKEPWERGGEMGEQKPESRNGPESDAPTEKS